MTQDQLRHIFQSNYSRDSWYDLLRFLFEGPQKPCQLRLLESPVSIPVPDEERMDGLHIGQVAFGSERLQLYVFELKDNTQIKRNRVGLRNMVNYLRDVDDAALVVYHTLDKKHWRVSYIYDIVGKTALKRYSFAFGEDKTYKTAIQNFTDLERGQMDFRAIQNAFSVEALNKEFYKFIAIQFYQLVGGITGTGKNKNKYARIMRLPGRQDDLVYHEFAVRLIGRTVFCWFLKEKKSSNGVPLLPAELLSSKSLETYSDYYHTVLERIFFQTLNTPIKERVKNLPKGCELIPFLNGGLFDYPHDFYEPEEDGLSKCRNELHIPDEWFVALFEKLEHYNFTIDENSSEDAEVSVDPEMLGRIFENLLAEINPESDETARKITGSFYTPREIVDYMAIESLVYYLNRKTCIDRDMIYTLFRSTEVVEFTAPEREKLLVALDELKILDPACGSGAFPMGVLAKITGALQILDKEAVWWKERQLRRIDNAKVRQDMQEKLDTATVEYARKIGIIQNTLYGVDIQPIAAEISKLRCFLTLIVDENVDDSKTNRGVDPLPNLEFKFITADSLLKLPAANAFAYVSTDDMERLRQLRINYLQSYGATKFRIKNEFREIQQKIYNDQAGNSILDPNSREYKISCWNPFSNEQSDWFDPEWMFGVIGGFDIVVGNPPYVDAKKLKGTSIKLKPDYKVYSGTADLSCYFTERGLNLTKKQGILLFITTNKFFTTGYGEKVRSYLSKLNIYELIDFEQVEVFENTLVSSVVLGVINEPAKDGNEFMYEEFYKLKHREFLIQFDLKKGSWETYPQSKLNSSEWTFSDDTQSDIKHKIGLGCAILSSIPGVSIFRGVTTGYNPAFIVDEELKQTLVDSDSKNEKIIMPLLQGRHIKKWCYNDCGENLIFTKQGINIEDYPAIKAHLQQFYFHLEPRKEEEADTTSDTKEKKGRKPGTYKWYEIQDNTAYHLEFEKPEKIIWGLTADKWSFAYDDKQHYLPSNGYILTSTSVPVKYLLAILNSNLMRCYFGFIGVMTAGGAYTLKHSTIQRLPVRIADDTQPFIDLVNQILATKSANPTADTSTLESEIDRMVYDLYGLTNEEVIIIEKS